MAILDPPHLHLPDDSPTIVDRELAAAELRRRLLARAEEKDTAEAAAVHPLLRYTRDPVGFVEAFVPSFQMTDYQADIFRGLVEGDSRAAAKGPRGLGKSALAALAIIWWATVWEAIRADWKVVVTSGSWLQLGYCFAEVWKWVRLVDWEALGRDPWRPEVELLKLGVRLDYGQVISASPERSDLIEGAHVAAVEDPVTGVVRPGAVLVVFDEAKIIKRQTFDAIEGVFSNVDQVTTFGSALAVSTPGAPMGRFYDIHARRPGTANWTARSVTLGEAIAAGRVTQAWADNLASLWGTDSPFYRQQVEGSFAADQEGSVIPTSWVEAAVVRWHTRQAEGWAPPPELDLSVDVAREGKDKTVVAVGRGADYVDRFVEIDRTDDFMNTATDIRTLINGVGIRPSRVVVDADGMGAGLGDILRSWGLPVEFFRGAPRPEGWRDRSGELEAFNRRSAAWWNMRELLDPRHNPTLCLPPVDELLGDLTAPKLVSDGKGRIRVEEKAQTKARLGRSPDHGDACVMRHFREPVTLVREFVPDDGWAARARQPGAWEPPPPGVRAPGGGGWGQPVPGGSTTI